MTYGTYLDELIDTVKAELRFRNSRGIQDETLEQAYLALLQGCEEHKALLRWADYMRAGEDSLAGHLRDSAYKDTVKALTHAAEIAVKHG
jgi:hypothetical protein